MLWGMGAGRVEVAGGVGGAERASASGEGCGGERVERRHEADVLGKGIRGDGTDGGFGEREDPQESRAQQTIVARGLREDRLAAGSSSCETGAATRGGVL